MRNRVSLLSSFIPSQVSSLKLILFMPFIGKKIRIASTVFMVSAFIPLWLVTEAITPQIVQADTTRVDLVIDRLSEENYETLLRRAEAVARASAQRSFDRDILVTDVSIIVSVQNYGAIAPVLSMEVSRQQWRTRPDPRLWATYFKTARSLLFFGDITTVPADNPSPTNTPAPGDRSTDPTGNTQPTNVAPNLLPVPSPPPTPPVK